jgi:hypothetical protein
MADSHPSPLRQSSFSKLSRASHEEAIIQQSIADIPIPTTLKNQIEITGEQFEQGEEEQRLVEQQQSQSQVPVYQEIPEFTSALSFTQVRDFGYPTFHPLHYGVPFKEDDDSDNSYENENENEQPDGRPFDDGPPWEEDDDLTSPVVRSRGVGDRITKEYQFSVASADEIHGRAVALFDFSPENDNEVALREGQIIWVSYRHGQGWLVAEDPDTGETGLVPEEYVQIFSREGTDKTNTETEIYQSPESDNEGWVDEESEEIPSQTDEPADYNDPSQSMKKLSVDPGL